MKFETRQEAARYAKMESYRTKVKHKAVKTRYWSMALMEWVPCWAVVIAPR